MLVRVCVNQAHRNGRSAERKYAWSLYGKRAECYLTNSRGVSTSFFVAMSHDRMLYWKITQPPPGQESSDDFLFFALDNLLPHMNAYDPTLPCSQQNERCVLILENVRVHDQAALTLVESRGLLVLPLPPYSPDYNPNQEVFAFGSSCLLRLVTCEHYNAWCFYTASLMLASITPEM